MGYIGTKPTAAPLTSSQLEDGLVTAAKLATDAVETAKVKDLNVTVAKLPAAVDISTKTVTLPATVAGLGTGITNAQLAGSITDAKITGLSSSKLTGALPAISGTSLTALNATNLGSGTVPTARLGTGTASSSVFLAGDNTWAEAGGGKIGQVISTTKTDTFSVTGDSSFADVTDLSAAITPSASDSKILVLWNIEIGHSATGNSMLTRLLRDSTAISIGDAAGNRQRALTGQTSAYSNAANTTRSKAGSFLDSPSSTSATTYKLQIFSDGGTIYCNRDGSYDDATYCATGTSTITVIEVLA